MNSNNSLGLESELGVGVLAVRKPVNQIIKCYFLIVSQWSCSTAPLLNPAALSCKFSFIL